MKTSRIFGYAALASGVSQVAGTALPQAAHQRARQALRRGHESAPRQQQPLPNGTYLSPQVYEMFAQLDRESAQPAHPRA